MAVRRGRRVNKGPAQRVGSSKVVKVTSPVVWERLLSKLPSGKLLVIHFSAVSRPNGSFCRLSCVWSYTSFVVCAALRLPFIPQVWSQPSARLRLYFTDLAKRPQYSHVMFVEIDVDHMTVR